MKAQICLLWKTDASGGSTGDLVFDSTLCNLKANIVGQTASLTSTLSVVGATTLQSTLNISKAVTCGSTLNVTEATALSSTLTVSKAATFSDILDVTKQQLSKIL